MNEREPKNTGKNFKGMKKTRQLWYIIESIDLNLYLKA